MVNSKFPWPSLNRENATAFSDTHFIVCNCIQWLETDFLNYLDEWDTSVHSCSEFTPAEMKKMGLSDETLAGLKVTGMTNKIPISSNPISSNPISSNKRCRCPISSLFFSFK